MNILPTATCSRDDESARDAVERYSQVLRFDADDAAAWHALGAALAALGDRAGAFTALRNSLLLDETRAQAHLALGRLLFDTVRFDDALRCFECAAALIAASAQTAGHLATR